MGSTKPNYREMLVNRLQELNKEIPVLEYRLYNLRRQQKIALKEALRVSPAITDAEIEKADQGTAKQAAEEFNSGDDR